MDKIYYKWKYYSSNDPLITRYDPIWFAVNIDIQNADATITEIHGPMPESWLGHIIFMKKFVLPSFLIVEERYSASFVLMAQAGICGNVSL